MVFKIPVFEILLFLMFFKSNFTLDSKTLKISITFDSVILLQGKKLNSKNKVCTNMLTTKLMEILETIKPSESV